MHWGKIAAGAVGFGARFYGGVRASPTWSRTTPTRSIDPLEADGRVQIAP